MRSSLWKKGMLIAAVAVLGAGLMGIPNTNTTERNPYVVEAAAKKKDTKKPKITLKGEKEMTVIEGEAIKVPKATAKDNVDGNVTKELKIKVKKGNKNYKSEAKKIKNNKKVKFNETGKYVITYTVTDKAGNKATKKRIINVISKIDTYNDDFEIPTENPTTEVVTTEEITTQTTTEKITTEKITTETPITEEPAVVDKEYQIYNYNINDNSEMPETLFATPGESDFVTINVENDYFALLFDRDCEELVNNYEYLKYLGKITATDKNGNDISDSIIIWQGGLVNDINNNKGTSIVIIYVKDSEGHAVAKHVQIHFTDYFELDWNDYKLINNNPKVYAEPWPKTYSKNDEEKKYIFSPQFI